MAGSLFDQLKKAGLVDEKKAKKAKQEKYQQTKQNKGKKGEVQQTEAAKLAAKAVQQKAERDRQLNLERQQQQAQKAAQAELRQLIESNRLKNTQGEVNYNFADGSSVKNILVNSDTHRRLANGRIRIAKLNDGYVLISDEAAEKVERRDKTVLIPLVEANAGLSKEDQDYYAQFEIPDDLIW